MRHGVNMLNNSQRTPGTQITLPPRRTSLLSQKAVLFGQSTKFIYLRGSSDCPCRLWSRPRHSVLVREEIVGNLHGHRDPRCLYVFIRELTKELCKKGAEEMKNHNQE